MGEWVRGGVVGRTAPLRGTRTRFHRVPCGSSPGNPVIHRIGVEDAPGGRDVTGDPAGSPRPGEARPPGDLLERERQTLQRDLEAGAAFERGLRARGEAEVAPGVSRLRTRAMGHRVGRLALFLGQSIATNDLSGVSAEMAYRFLFAFLPVILIAIAVLDVLQQFAPGSDLPGKLIVVLGAILPAPLVDPLGSLVRELSRPGALGLGLGGLVGAAWGASGAANALIKGLNRAYGIEFDRPWWKRQLLGVAAALAFPLIAVGAVVLYLLGSDLVRTLGGQLGGQGTALSIWHQARQPLTALVLLLGFWLIYRALPHVRQTWRQALPGAVVAMVGWLILAQAFETYLQFSRGISIAVASIGLGIAVLLWFYFLGLVMLLGAEVNAALRREFGGPPDAPAPQPPG